MPGAAGGGFNIKEKTNPKKGLAARISPNPLSPRDTGPTQSNTTKSAAPYPAAKTIVELFEAQVARTPNAEAIRLGNQSLNYRQLNERANQLAAHLRTMDVGLEQPVILYMEHSLEVVCAILGVLKAGAAYVPIDPGATPTQRLSFILRDILEGTAGSAAPLLVTQTRLLSNLPGD